jgi:hypothetical protein
MEIRTIAKYLVYLDIIIFSLLSSFYTYKNWDVLEHSNLKECNYLGALTGVILCLYVLAGLFIIGLFLFNCFCNWCSRNQTNNVTFKKVLFIILFLGSYGFILYEFIRSHINDDPCYTNFKKKYNDIWLLFNAEVINLAIIFVLWIFGFCRCKICSREKDSKKDKLLPE